ncbi:MAG: aminodeoxychorismate synthase component I [Paludibacterium sp.]|uniref:aminodeoxychorismate synthase component I n=1 Tax=Paludibacterium sp. TaxID=1917523 RepID=UPI0025D689D7|nr:aminodeoxychorismate synthase component I [Paludibacterium sp.]MBV8047841.1 aminodeoxychorismate synthase component I [Paludibacterium sp.]MBV8648135.1 aminodeoxychorismate synthase component I [Paludibacterium sp.]
MHVEALADLPDLLALHAADRRRFPYLLMSDALAGWDILFALPRELRLYAENDAARCLADLRALPRRADIARPAEIPFAGGWFVFLGYEMLQAFEDKVADRGGDDFPLAALARIPAAVLVERGAGRAWAVAEDAESWAELNVVLAEPPAPFSPIRPELLSLGEDEPTRYTDAVVRLKRYICEGDVFQVNISRGWRAELAPDCGAADLFAALRRANPAPFSALADFGQTQIVSSSPERLVEARDGWVQTRPIAGTHPRSTDPREDEALKARLIGSVKERAEHVMLIDLERNDLGRICVPGTVEVNELMAVASYAYVHHIESNVRGRLRPGVQPADILRALFPGGTITGCPKVRTMQIIRELEDGARRAYTGSLGYINHDGSLDFNILIRTFMRQGPVLRFRAGGGIVADSDPERELMETRHKARGLLRALGVADQ